jgi:hypothetical protein
MGKKMRSYTGMEGYQKLTQIREIVNSEFFKTFNTDFFQKIEQTLKKKEAINDEIRSTAHTLRSLTSNTEGQQISTNTVLENVNRAINFNKAKIKQAALKQKQWNSTRNYGIGLGLAFPILDALFLSNGELPIRLFVFSLVATTALAASIFYCCGKRLFKLKEFDQAEHNFATYIEKDFAQYFDSVARRQGVTNSFKLESYTQKFNINPDNSPLLLTMKDTVVQALTLRKQGETIGR